MIDSPGEYAESKRFSASLRSFIQRPLIGIITKIDSPYANIPMVRQWLETVGCERIFLVNNVAREGINDLLAYLDDDVPQLTMEQAKVNRGSDSMNGIRCRKVFSIPMKSDRKRSRHQTR